MSTAATPISDAKLAANRANAQQSTGPVTSEGKAKSCMNAVKTGLTGRTVLLPAEDAALYTAHIENHFSKYTPINDEERTLVQMIADTEWRLLRIPELEAGIYAVGERKLPEDLFSDVEDSVRRRHLIRAEVYLVFRRELSNIALQESRLNRQLDKYTAKLEEMQTLRRKTQLALLQRASSEYKTACERKQDYDPAKVGFEFSKEELLFWLNTRDTHARRTAAQMDLDQVRFELRTIQKAA